ncbi:hypothetical protein MMC22_008537 [Lobaria immixta]|nr:hypothetical protein [Lobaria immixta]
MIARRPTSVCAEPISLEGEGLCKASPEVYAAPWRSFPAREWENDKLPIEGLDRCASHRQQIEKRKLLAGGAPPSKVQFAQKRRWRIVSRWIEDPE